MSAFKVGQRVRIVGGIKLSSAQAPCRNKEATIWRIAYNPNWTPEALAAGLSASEPAYCLDVDGVGKWHFDGCAISVIAAWIRPLTNPDESAWNEFKTRHLTPDPAIILAKEAA